MNAIMNGSAVGTMDGKTVLPIGFGRLGAAPAAPHSLLLPAKGWEGCA